MLPCFGRVQEKGLGYIKNMYHIPAHTRAHVISVFPYHRCVHLFQCPQNNIGELVTHRKQGELAPCDPACSTPVIAHHSSPPCYLIHKKTALPKECSLHIYHDHVD